MKGNCRINCVKPTINARTLVADHQKQDCFVLPNAPAPPKLCDILEDKCDLPTLPDDSPYLLEAIDEEVDANVLEILHEVCREEESEVSMEVLLTSVGVKEEPFHAARLVGGRCCKNHTHVSTLPENMISYKKFQRLAKKDKAARIFMLALKEKFDDESEAGLTETEVKKIKRGEVAKETEKKLDMLINKLKSRALV